LLARYLVQIADEIDESATLIVAFIIGTSINDMQLYNYHLLKPTGQKTRLLDHHNVTFIVRWFVSFIQKRGDLLSVDLGRYSSQ